MELPSLPSRTNDTADALERAVPDFDALVRDVRLGTRSQAHFDELEERAQAIAKRIVDAFRKPPVRSGRPPLEFARRPDGSARAGW